MHISTHTCLFFLFLFTRPPFFYREAGVFLHRRGRIFTRTAAPICTFLRIFAPFWTIYLCIFTYFWTYLHPFISIFAHIFAHINMPIYTHTHLHASIHTPIPASLHTYIHTHISVKTHSWAFKRLSAGVFFPSGGIRPHPHTRICLSRALRCPKFQFSHTRAPNSTPAHKNRKKGHLNASHAMRPLSRGIYTRIRACTHTYI